MSARGGEGERATASLPSPYSWLWAAELKKGVPAKRTREAEKDRDCVRGVPPDQKL